MSSMIATFVALVGLSQGPAAGIPELMSLDLWAGDWESSSNVGGVERKGRSKGEWVLGGRYLRQSWTIDASGEMSAITGESLMTYDQRAGVYRQWAFDSTGGSQSGEGRWDAGSKTMTWETRDLSGDASWTTKARFPEAGREEWTIVVKDKAGTTLAEMSGKNRRKP